MSQTILFSLRFASPNSGSQQSSLFKMHVVGERQRQPLKHRHVSENLIRILYDIVLAVKYITLLVLIATATISAKRTFAVDFWSPNGFALSPVLTYKLANCTYATTVDMYAFRNASLTITSANNSELFTDFASQLRTLIIIAAVHVLLGAVNRELFRSNIFVKRFRHMYLHKDVLTMTEVCLLAWIFASTYHLDQQQRTLQAYFRSCNIIRTTYLPFVSLTTMYVFVGSACASFVIAVLVLLVNAVGKNIVPENGDSRSPVNNDGESSSTSDGSAEMQDAGPNIDGQSLGDTQYSVRMPPTPARQSRTRRRAPASPSASTTQQQAVQRASNKAPTAYSTAPPPPPDSFYLFQNPNRM